jgi:pimeloyl-ACP methyl ester carboxylesterase
MSAVADTDRVHAFRRAEAAVFARYGIEVAERVLDLGGSTVRVLESGDGPPVLLVPGDGAVAGAWAPLLAELRGNRAIVLDRPGAGLSGPFDRRAGDLRGQAVAMLTASLDALGLERATVIGSSGGAAWALWTALEAPQRVAAVASLGMPGVCLPGVRPLPPMRVLSIPGLGRLLARIPAPSPDATGRLLAKTDARLLDHPEIVALYHAAGRLPGYPRSVADLFGASMRPGGAPRAACVIGDDDLRALETPVRFVFGADEPLGGPDVVRRAADLMPHARVEVVPGAWHHPWLADASAVGRLVPGFVPSP